jgi:hypothetical protein
MAILMDMKEVKVNEFLLPDQQQTLSYLAGVEMNEQTENLAYKIHEQFMTTTRMVI